MTEMLNEDENKIEIEPEDSKTLKLTICCLCFIPMCFVLGFITEAVLHPRIGGLFVLLAFVSFALATLGSLLSLIVNFRSFKKLLVSFLIFIICCSIWIAIFMVGRFVRKREAYYACGRNLKTIGMVIKSRAEKNIDFRMTNQWCDDLLNEIGEDGFICPNSKKSKSSYALNKNVVGKKLNDLYPGTILIFESVDGWNLVGGTELISFDNHDRYENGGVHVLYCDWHVEYVKPELIEQYPQDWEAIEDK